MSEDPRLTQATDPVGQLIDRCVEPNCVLGVVTLITPGHVLTSAHLVFKYRRYLEALAVGFPASWQVFGVSAVELHPDFSEADALALTRRSYFEAVAALPLSNGNLALLTLGPPAGAITPELLRELDAWLANGLPEEKRGLSGSLDEIELTSILQTLANSRKEGNLILFDARNQPAGLFYLTGGRLLHARAGELNGEAAVYQMLGETKADKFVFYPGRRPGWKVKAEIKRPLEMLLMEGCRRADESPKLIEQLGGELAVYVRKAGQPDVQKLSAETRPIYAGMQALLDGTLVVKDLVPKICADRYAVLTALTEMKQAGLVDFLDDEILREVQPQLHPVKIGAEVPLVPGEEVTALALDPHTQSGLKRVGRVLGKLRPDDARRLVHDVVLPDRTSGSPLLKEGKLIGIHNGPLPYDLKKEVCPEALNQCVWIDSFYDLPSSGGRPGAARHARYAASAGSGKEDSEAGCEQTASLACPSCHQPNPAMSIVCSFCGAYFITPALEDLWRGFLSPGGIKVLLLSLAVVIGVSALSALAVATVAMVSGHGGGGEFGGVTSDGIGQLRHMLSAVDDAELIHSLLLVGVVLASFLPAALPDVFRLLQVIAATISVGKIAFPPPCANPARKLIGMHQAWATRLSQAATAKPTDQSKKADGEDSPEMDRSALPPAGDAATSFVSSCQPSTTEQLAALTPLVVPLLAAVVVLMAGQIGALATVMALPLFLLVLTVPVRSVSLGQLIVWLYCGALICAPLTWLLEATVEPILLSKLFPVVGSALVGPIIEESITIIPLVLLFLFAPVYRYRFGAVDMMLSGVAVGTGFALVEALLWVTHGGYRLGALGPALGNVHLLPDTINSYIGHGAATGFVALALGCWRYSGRLPWLARRVGRFQLPLIPLIVFVWVTLDHAVANFQALRGSVPPISWVSALDGNGQVTVWAFLLAAVSCAIWEYIMLNACDRKERSQGRHLPVENASKVASQRFFTLPGLAFALTWFSAERAYNLLCNQFLNLRLSHDLISDDLETARTELESESLKAVLCQSHGFLTAMAAVSGQAGSTKAAASA